LFAIDTAKLPDGDMARRVLSVHIASFVSGKAPAISPRKG
jgi:hypothetical protein